MSQWGKLDRLVSTGTLTATNDSNAIVGDATTVFTGNVKAGDALLLNNVAYAVKVVNTANTLTLDTVYAGSTANTLSFAVQQSPKDLATYGWGNVTVAGNTIGKQDVYGVDRVEIGVAGNKANGFSHTGWSSYNTYTTTQGATRRKVEVLVAMSKNFNANAAGNLQADANDNTVLPNS